MLRPQIGELPIEERVDTGQLYSERRRGSLDRGELGNSRPRYSNAQAGGVAAGRAMLSTIPSRVHGLHEHNRYGTGCLLLWPHCTLPEVRITSGVSAKSAAANSRRRSSSPWAQRASIRALPPSIHPNSFRPCLNPACRSHDSGSSSSRI